MAGWEHRLSDINDAERTGTCAHCGKVSLKRKKSGRGGWQCRKAAKKGRHAYPGRNNRWAREALLQMMGDRCQICEAPATALDHCHTLERARGMLCHKCNLGLGYFRDDLDLLIRATAYLQAFIENGPPIPTRIPNRKRASRPS